MEPALRRQRELDPGAYWPAGLQANDTLCLKQTRWLAPEEHHHRLSSGLHMYVYTYMHTSTTCVRVCTHSHPHMPTHPKKSPSSIFVISHSFRKPTSQDPGSALLHTVPQRAGQLQGFLGKVSLFLLPLQLALCSFHYPAW